ncbi:HNH endonuclease-domain-containing protein [Penicillium taxi]|uniref:HNH endonuclease-domain-containing protein n=1 Tax=Penicillium taxi TaxID=168475 RepID=UPI0025459ED5|nr:HNH endonuclease-domain-containing protein [Penicillium taxi]KAJ5908968.1 HNH endonuclease-domain-containing protein [Penicillium taxi]
MRAAAEPIWEHYLPPGSDMIGTIQSGPRPNVRMELELFSRLYGFKQEESSDEDENDLATELKAFQRLEC